MLYYLNKLLTPLELYITLYLITYVYMCVVHFYFRHV